MKSMALFDDRVVNFANSAADMWRSMFVRLSSHSLNASQGNAFCIQLDLTMPEAQTCGIRAYNIEVS